MNLRTLATTTAICLSVGLTTANAGVITSASFNGVTNAAVNTTGTLDWGYFSHDGDAFNGVYNNLAFGALPEATSGFITTVSGSSQIGAVTLTENDGVTDVIQAQTNDALFTFDGNATFGSYGGFAPGEDDIWTLTFNDLGIGTFNITLYMGHSSTNRIFNVNATLTDTGGSDTEDTVSPQIGTLGSTVEAYPGNGVSFTYDISVTTTAADADLELVFGGNSGSFGGAIFAGYTVDGTIIPEPASLALVGLGGLLIAGRKRR
jgi:hypothetical protein